jgi:hypothetical protein
VEDHVPTNKLTVTPTEWIGDTGSIHTIKVVTPTAKIDPSELYYPANTKIALTSGDTFDIAVVAGLNRVHFLWDPVTLPPTQETFILYEIDKTTGATIQPLTNPDIVTPGWSWWVFGH